MSDLDITDTLAPKSEQLDAIDLRTSGPRIFTVERVSRGNAEQPLNISLVEFDRPWKPGVSMRRVLAYCWGNDASKWVGRRVKLYCDDTITFGKERPGGTRIESLSHIDGPKSVPLLISQGRSSDYKVQPLTESQGDLNIAACESIPQLREAWKHADTATKARIEARVKELEQVALGGDESA